MLTMLIINMMKMLEAQFSGLNKLLKQKLKLITC
jgi:hypothetical protein